MSTLTDHRSVDVTNEFLVPRHVYVLSLILSAVSAVAAGLTFFVPEVLLGPAVTNGNARGTALVVLVLAVPTLLISIALVARDSRRAVFFWLGSLFYLGYNGFLLLFLTPFNRLFLLYVAMESLAIFAIFGLIMGCDRHRLVAGMRRLPYRGLAVFVWVIVSLNALAWLAVVVPAVLAPDPLSFLDGTGVATNALYVQDLVLWLPLMALAAWGLWNERTMGVLLTGSWLVFGVIESIGVAVDQWFGHQADPASSFASETAIPIMIVLAVVNMIGASFYLRSRRAVPSP